MEEDICGIQHKWKTTSIKENLEWKTKAVEVEPYLWTDQPKLSTTFSPNLVWSICIWINGVLLIKKKVIYLTHFLVVKLLFLWVFLVIIHVVMVFFYMSMLKVWCFWMLFYISLLLPIWVKWILIFSPTHTILLIYFRAILCKDTNFPELILLITNMLANIQVFFCVNNCVCL